MQRSDSDLSSALSLSNIRQTLIRLEDTIIFGLIERAQVQRRRWGPAQRPHLHPPSTHLAPPEKIITQFALNPAVYQPDAIPVPGFRGDGRRHSLLEYALRDIEQARKWGDWALDLGVQSGRAWLRRSCDALYRRRCRQRGRALPRRCTGASGGTPAPTSTLSFRRTCRRWCSRR